MNSAMFDIGGPDLTGTWKNFNTGEVITIRDTIIEEGQVTGISMNGSMVPYNKLQNFVKCDPSEVNTPIQKQSTKKAPQTEFIDDIDSDNYSAGQQILTTPNQSPNDTLLRPSRVETRPQVPTIDPAIEKVLKGLDKKNQPKIEIDIKWPEIPEGVVFLQKYLGVSVDDIVDALCEKFVDIEEIHDKLTEKLKSIVKKGFEPAKEEKKKK